MLTATTLKKNKKSNIGISYITTNKILMYGYCTLKIALQLMSS